MASFMKAEETNWQRACRLLIEAGGDLLLLFLQQKVATLYLSLNDFLASNKPTLMEMNRKGKLFQSQLQLLYPEQPDKWDITLITTLLNRLVNLTSIENQCINNIRTLRNQIFAHIREMKMDDADFHKSWQQIQKVLTDIATKLLKNPKQFDLQAKISSIEKEELIDGEKLRELLQSWQSSDVALLDEVQQIKDGQRTLVGMVETVQQSQAEHTGKLSEVERLIKEREWRCPPSDALRPPLTGNLPLDMTVPGCSTENASLNYHLVQICGIPGPSAGLFCSQTEGNHSSNKQGLSTDGCLSLQRGLIEYYTSHVIQAPVTIQGCGLQTHISNIYAEPSMVRIDHKAVTVDSHERTSKNRNPNDRNITYRDMFNEHKHKKIYVCGNAGVGKTSFCKSLVAAWCSAHSSDDDAVSSKIENDKGCQQNTLKGFDFLFYISLRHARDDYDIREMILSQLLNNNPLIKPSSYGLKTSEDILDKLLLHHSEKCLIILDGLDEWSSPCTSRYPSVSDGIPGRNPHHRYTILTTSRPWKLERVRLKATEIDIQIELTGIQSVRAFGEKILQHVKHLNILDKLKSFDDFLKKVSKISFCNLEQNPIVLKQLIFLWLDGVSFGDSYTEIYLGILELLFKLWEEKNSRQKFSISKGQCEGSTWPPLPLKKWGRCDRYNHLLMSLGRLAFETILTEHDQVMLVFESDETDIYGLSSEDIDIGLAVGILTQSIVPNMTVHKKRLSFLHKSFHELCAAIYLAAHNCSNDDILKMICNKLKSVDQLLAVQDMLVFLSGMCPNLVTQLSDCLANIINNDSRIQNERLMSRLMCDTGVRHLPLLNSRIIDVQTLVLKICHERCEYAKQSVPPTLPVPDILLNGLFPIHILPTLNKCLFQFPTEVRSFTYNGYVCGVSTLAGILTVERCNGIDKGYEKYSLDLTNFCKLESVQFMLSRRSRLQIKINADQLASLFLKNVSSQEIVTIIRIARSLRSLHLAEVTSCEGFCKHLCECALCLDLTVCTKLTSLLVADTPVSCLTLNDCIELLTLKNVSVPHKQGIPLDLTVCTKLRSLLVACTQLNRITLNDCIELLTLDNVSVPHGHGLHLELSVCTKLKYLSVAYTPVNRITLNNFIEKLKLDNVYVPLGQGLHLDLRVCRKLTSLSVKHTPLSSLTLNDCIDCLTLEHVSRPHRPELHLDLTVCRNLTSLSVEHTPLSNLTLNECIVNLTLDTVSVRQRGGLHIDLTVCRKLSSLSVKHTPLSNLTLNDCIDCLTLERVSVPYKKWLHLDLTVCKKLTSLSVKHTPVSSLTLNDCIVNLTLEHVSEPIGRGLQLDLTVCRKLIYAKVLNTPLSSLTLNGCIVELILVPDSVSHNQVLHLDFRQRRQVTDFCISKSQRYLTLDDWLNTYNT